MFITVLIFYVPMQIANYMGDWWSMGTTWAAVMTMCYFSIFMDRAKIR